MKINFVFLLFIFTFHHSFGANEDEIISLPGLAQKPSFRQYSGYLNGGPDIHLHYWFVESQGNPKTDPLVLWLNGGPGCSSMDGLLTENGPFRVGSDGQTVTLDPHSWNTLANVLYLESPVGVGYSYTSKNETFSNSDDTTAALNYLALEDFFKKYPQFKTNAFYITGESYAGIYIPTLAVEIFRNNATFNLKGLGIGNGVLDKDLLTKSQLDLSLAHGFTDAKRYDDFVINCCTGSAHNQTICDLKTAQCSSKGAGLISNYPGDPYNIFDDCNDDEYYARLHRVLEAKFDGLIDLQDIKSMRLFSTPPSPICKNSNYTGYMNSVEVRKALHVSDQVKHWTLCGNVHYLRQYRDMRAQIRELVEVHKVPIVVYNGDIDMVCDFLGDQRFVDSLGYKLIDKYRLWISGKRIGGYVKRYEGITFTTVRGAGHMVPADQPEAALAVLKELLGIKKLLQ